MIALLIAAGGLVFAFEHATIAGKLVLLLLAVVSIFSWSVMITKMRVIQFARKQNAHFLAAFCVLFAPIYLTFDSFFSMNAFEQLKQNPASYFSNLFVL